jgi:hypothetical protein
MTIVTARNPENEDSQVRQYRDLTVPANHANSPVNTQGKNNRPRAAKYRIIM